MLKMLTWNCGGAFRQKYQAVQEVDPDIWIIQECEDPSQVKKSSTAYQDYCANFLWTGENKHKGLGIFAKPGLSLEPINLNQIYRGRMLKWFLPFTINHTIKALAIWNHHNDAKAFTYIGQFWLLLEQNKNLLEDFIMLGDFNGNARWDHWDRWWNHTDCVNALKALGISSVYHTLNNQKHGEESDPTFFMHRNPKKPYHIDYVFSPEQHIENSEMTIHSSPGWLELSDHLPITWFFKPECEENNAQQKVSFAHT